MGWVSLGDAHIGAGRCSACLPLVTELAPAGPFWQAEPEHQDYLERIPNGYTCHFVRPNWKLPKRMQMKSTDAA